MQTDIVRSTGSTLSQSPSSASPHYGRGKDPNEKFGCSDVSQSPSSASPHYGRWCRIAACVTSGVSIAIIGVPPLRRHEKLRLPRRRIRVSIAIIGVPPLRQGKRLRCLPCSEKVSIAIIGVPPLRQTTMGFGHRPRSQDVSIAIIGVPPLRRRATAGRRGTTSQSPSSASPHYGSPLAKG